MADVGASPRKRKKSKPKKGKNGKRLKVDPAKVMKIVEKIYEDTQKEFKRKKTAVTLGSLNLQDATREVDILSADEVRREIEEIVLRIDDTLMRDEGMCFKIPSRSSSNQIYVKELDRIVLKNQFSNREFANIKNARKAAITMRVLNIIYETRCKNISVTKRDLFYTDVKLFKDQRDSDLVIEDVACMLGATRPSLGVLASAKGVVVGCSKFKEDGDEIDCMKQGSGGKAITPDLDKITDIRGSAKFILLVEKDAAFQRLAQDRFYQEYPCVLITAKGQPDVATRMFLKKVVKALGLPVLGLVDADPYGLKILSVYMSGSKNMSYDSAHLTTANIKWLGVRPSDLDRLQISEQCRLPMTPGDIKTGQDLLKEDFIQQNPEWVKELEWMIEHKVKAEIQALSSKDLQYLTKEYLPHKILNKDWI